MNTATLTQPKTTFAAKEAKDNFGLLLDTAQRRPVTIKKKGRSVAVLMSMEEYEILSAQDDAYWAARAEEAKKGGSLGVKASADYVRTVLNASD